MTFKTNRIPFILTISFAMAIAILLLACTGQPVALIPNANERTTIESTNQHETNQSIYVTHNSWHTGIVVPAKALYQKIPALKKRFGNKSYLELGWGDLDFYQANDITISLILKAIFWPTDSVMHAVAFNLPPQEYFYQNTVVAVPVTDHEFAILISFLVSSFERSDPDQHVTALGKGIYGNSEFYKGTGSYYAFNTCNTWTAKALVSAGLDVNPTLKLTATSVMNLVEKD